MARIVFEVDIATDTSPIVAALDTERGIASWWTDEVTLAGEVGSTMTLGFPTAPKPFVLQVAEVGSQRVRWESIGDFPPPGSVPRSSGRCRPTPRAARSCTSPTRAGPTTAARSRWRRSPGPTCC
jgi:hypothetical protein